MDCLSTFSPFHQGKGDFQFTLVLAINIFDLEFHWLLFGFGFGGRGTFAGFGLGRDRGRGFADNAFRILFGFADHHGVGGEVAQALRDVREVIRLSEPSRFDAILLDVGYVGTISRHLMQRIPYNEPNFGSAWLPANLIQAQRDYFGAHTYERNDAKGTFHTEWEKE